MEDACELRVKLLGLKATVDLSSDISKTVWAYLEKFPVTS